MPVTKERMCIVATTIGMIIMLTSATWIVIDTLLKTYHDGFIGMMWMGFVITLIGGMTWLFIVENKSDEGQETKGMKCPHCGGGEVIAVHGLLYQCTVCQKKFIGKVN